MMLPLNFSFSYVLISFFNFVVHFFIFLVACMYVCRTLSLVCLSSMCAHFPYIPSRVWKTGWTCIAPTTGLCHCLHAWHGKSDVGENEKATLTDAISTHGVWLANRT